MKHQHTMGVYNKQANKHHSRIMTKPETKHETPTNNGSVQQTNKPTP